MLLQTYTFLQQRVADIERLSAEAMIYSKAGDIGLRIVKFITILLYTNNYIKNICHRSYDVTDFNSNYDYKMKLKL